MPRPALLVVTGASGVGKTALVRGLERRALPSVRCHYFDSIGVPAPEAMIREYGSGEEWQRAMTERWVRRLADETPPGSLAVLDGQVRPSFVVDALAATPVPVAEILLIDCDHGVREARLRGERGQPELATAEMAAWAAYLRGQADALGLPRLDTSSASVEESLVLLVQHAARLLQQAAD
jgi:hypothetical protein